MESDLARIIADYSDAFLLEQYCRNAGQYTPEALSLMEEEIDRRAIAAERIEQYRSGTEETTPSATSRGGFAREEFEPLSSKVQLSDIFAIQAILMDSEVPFIVEVEEPSSTLPIDSEPAERYFTVSVPRSCAEKAHTAIDEHFHSNEGRFVLRHRDLGDRLKSFSFYELHITESDASTIVSVSMSDTERRIIVSLIKKLLAQADYIENDQERILFYFDALDELADKLSDDTTQLRLCKSDLLAIIEVFQVFGDDPLVTERLHDTAETLLDFFSQP